MERAMSDPARPSEKATRMGRTPPPVKQAYTDAKGRWEAQYGDTSPSEDGASTTAPGLEIKPLYTPRGLGSEPATWTNWDSRGSSR